MLVLPDDMVGRPIGFTCSTFDLLHAGHILMLAEAKAYCSHLIVGLQTDPTIDRPQTKNKPVQSVVERFVQLSAVKFVDDIIVYETERDLEDLLMFLPITMRFIGEEYYGKEITPQTEMVLWINDWIKALNTIKEELVQKNDTEMVALFEQEIEYMDVMRKKFLK